MRQARLDDFCESDEGYLYSEEYYQTLLWMSPEKLREIVPALLDNASGQEIIQIESHETLLEKEQSVSKINCILLTVTIILVRYLLVWYCLPRDHVPSWDLFSWAWRQLHR